MDDTGLVDLEINLTLLDFLHSLSNIHSHSATLWVRHQSARSENTSERTNLAHARRHSDNHIHISPAALDLVDIFLEAHVVGTSLLGSSLLVGSAKTEYAHYLASATWQRHHAANHLVGLTGVDTQTNVDVDRSLELGGGDFLHQLGCFLQCVGLPCFNLIGY